MNFNNISENSKSETLSWAVDSSVVVPPHYKTEASIIIEEMNYQGHYTVSSLLSGTVTISIRRQDLLTIGSILLYDILLHSNDRTLNVTVQFE